ncbi:N-acetyltransferase family protein [Clostridium sp. AL.422]|uniref:GNAT family N-acetyltransferase n=1 Tax=Clostridium TaxID=1485 RepID=UPI00293DF84F|nr:MULTISPECIES: N-acetyltransferase family protein [unclassified Clostridium]MDV4150055.1 N-acetyltransferase family protein [Clostridium sp. AL.422]
MIREMEYKDIDSVLDILSEAIKEGRSTFKRRTPTVDEWDKGHLQECRFVKVINDEVAGWVALSKGKLTSPAYDGVCEVSIYISSKFRGQGIGDELLKRVIKDSERFGYWMLESIVFSYNVASINLHIKNGFEIVGTRKSIAKDIFNNWQDVTLLDRRSDYY